MAISMKRAALLLSGTIAAGMYSSVAFAADIETMSALPAVSGINGKVEIGGGWADIDDLGDDEVFRGAAALSFPVGDSFGIQADLSALDAYGDTAISGALHAFTRDPNSYLFGIYGGYVDVGLSNIWYVGPEAELYLGNVSIEAVGGFMDIDGGNNPGSEFYALGDVGFYATDNLRLTVGASSVAGFESGHAGLEWFLADTGIPASFTLDGRLGEDGFTSAMAGFSVYFGGEDKSLIRRHREDDPRIRSLDLFSAGALGSGVLGQCDDPETVLNECFEEPIVH
jgi:catechol 2,3-dioxygenase-like lactoylglutathione lyase family enzyme